MKIIDLLNKIANGEEAPKKIAIENDVLIYNDSEILCLQDWYYRCDEEDATWKIWAYNLNDEVEIIEEDKKIEKLERFIPQRESDTYCTKYNEVADKINEIIDYINKGD